MNQKLLKLSIVSVLIGFLVLSAINVSITYSKPLTKIITENHMEEVQRVDFNFYAVYSDNELYGSSVQRGDKFFIEITDRIEGTIKVSPSSEVSTYAILKSGDYWEKQYKLNDSEFSLDINEYKNTVERINKQLGVRESEFSISVVTDTGTFTPQLLFYCDRIYVELVSDRTFTHEEKVEVEKIVPTGAEEERKDSIIYLLTSFFGLLIGTFIIVKRPYLLQHRRKFVKSDKSVTGIDRGGVFYIDEPKNLNKIAKLEGKQVLYDSGTEEWFFRTEGKEYRCKKK